MDMDLAAHAYVIVKGYIDAKDDRGRTMYGTLLGVVSRRDIKHLSVMFTREEISKSTDWSELLFMHEERNKTTDRDPLLVHHEEELHKFLSSSTILNGIAKNHNTKQAEQAISRYCTEQLQLKAVSFVEFMDASDNDIRLFDKSEEEKPEEAPADASPEVTREEVMESAPGQKNENELFIRCDPILDPVNGIAMNDLKLGDYVFGKLAEDSVFYKMLQKNLATFDGIVSAQVTGILVNELGTATVSLALSEGVTGIMKLSGKVRIRVAAPPEAEGSHNAPGKSRFSLSSLPTGAVFAIAGGVLLLSAVFLIYYILQ